MNGDGRRPHPFHVDLWAAVGPGWTVQEVGDAATAQVDHRNRVARVPAPTTAANVAVRLHEAMHALNGPFETEHTYFAMMLEEVRTNALALRNGIELQRYHDELDWASWPAPATPWHAAMYWLQVVTSACTIDSVIAGVPALRAECPPALARFWSDAAGALDDAGRAALARAAQAVAMQPDGATREAQAALLDARFAQPAGTPRPRMACGHDESAAEGPDAERSGRKAAPETTPGGAGERRPEGEPRGRSGHDPHAMTWQEWMRRAVPRQADLELTDFTRVPGRSRTVTAARRAVDSGREPKRWDHWATDQRIYERRERHGSMLVDASGSNRWDWEGLHRSLWRLPATTLAAYSGSDQRGRLWILARGGRWGEADLAKIGSNNLVDVEALEWLADQPEPRVWVSDGKINGGLVALMGTERAARHLRELARRHNIVRVNSVEDAVRHLRSRRRIPDSTRPGLATWNSPDFVVVERSAMGQIGAPVRPHARFVE